MCYVIAMASQCSVLSSLLPLKVTVSHTGLQACQQLLSGQVGCSHTRESCLLISDGADVSRQLILARRKNLVGIRGVPGHLMFNNTGRYYKSIEYCGAKVTPGQSAPCLCLLPLA